jgi:hypothetical protein
MSVQIRSLRVQDVGEFVNLMFMAHATDLRLLGVDDEKFAAQLHSALTNPILRALQAISQTTERYLVAESEGTVVGLVGLTGGRCWRS